MFVTLTLTLTITLNAVLAGQAVDAGQPDDACLDDLEQVVELLENDYAGWEFAQRTRGKELADALEKATAKARNADGVDCDRAIRTYLEAFGDGHFLLFSPHSPPLEVPTPLFEDRTPVIRALSDQVMLVRIPSFGFSYKQILDDLLAEHERAIIERPIMIIDLRQNSGGSGATGMVLAPILWTGPVQAPRLLWRATEGNAKAFQQQLESIPEDAPMRAAAQIIADALRENIGSLKPIGPPSPPVTFDHVWPNPQHVGIIVDGYSASAAEQFVLGAKQSGKVTVFGAKTYGAIDFGNLRHAQFPSGRTLQFGMSMNTRVLEPDYQPGGIQPDIELPSDVVGDADAAVTYVRALLEAGLRP